MSTIKYMPKDFEDKWADIWEKEEVYKISLNNQKEKVYTLSMFPYPSGAGLHTGHVRIYTGTDVLARFYRLKGYQVIHPMGWDAFGLPAENAAIKLKRNPADLIEEYIKIFKNQMKKIGFSYDWSREINTSDPNYYKWTQWLFIQFYKKGLLYKKDIPVNFCPKCKTGLAEEEVLSDGTHERCGTKIEKRNLPQWVFKITEYAEQLLADLEGLDWPEGILAMQKNWIGKSVGAEIDFTLSNTKEKITVFTTRPDTIFGATALIIAPEHKLVNSILNGEIKVEKKVVEKIKEYLKEVKSKSDLQRTELSKDKTGVDTTLYAINPVTQEKINIWIADYVLGWYGHGALMSVPAHDIRDFEFAKKYGLKIKPVISKNTDYKTNLEVAYTDTGYIIPNKEIDLFFKETLDLKKEPLKSEEFIKLITKELENKKIGKEKVQYKLRDWIFSRQRYWGEPIPMINCPRCGWVPVNEKDLPIKLPYVESYEPTGDGKSPLSTIENFVNTKCPICAEAAKRETDTMPNWAGSCWYFLRFADPQNNFEAWEKDKINTILPVDWYLGGQEHAVLHLLYSRFWIKILNDLGLISFKEPFKRLRNVGMVLSYDHRKMSKSWGNVINPDDVINEYGADALRVYEMFMAPFSSENSWSTKSLQGAYRFLARIWQIFNNPDKLTDDIKEQDIKVVSKLQKVIFNINEDMTNVKFNTAIAFMMEFINVWESGGKIHKNEAKKFLIILSLFAPFVTEEIWRNILKESKSINFALWPEINKEMLVEENFNVAIQINGKLRGLVEISKEQIDDKDSIISKALEQENIKKYLTSSSFKKVIYIKGKIINFVF